MKNFLIKSIVLLFFLTFINCWFLSIVNQYYYKEYDKVDLGKEIYLLADSHGVPLGKVLNDKCYNFSVGSESYVDMLRKVKYLIKYSTVKQIVLTVDDHTLSEYRDRLNNNDKSTVFFVASDYKNKYEYTKEKYFKRYVTFFNPKYSAFLYWYFYQKIFLSKKNHKLRKWIDYTEVEKNKKCKSRMDTQFNFQNKSSILTKSLLHIIKLCDENNIELIGIKYPLTKLYCKTLATKNFKADSILKSYNKNILDYKRIYIENDTLFENQDHLNKKGGKLFVKKILSDLSLLKVN